MLIILIAGLLLKTKGILILFLLLLYFKYIYIILNRIFGPSIYIDLKKDLNVHNIIDYMFDETVRNSHEINK